MTNIVTVGRRLIPREHIAFVEPYDPAANPRFQTAREFHGRVVLLNRDSVLIAELPQVFAEANGFNMLEADRVATNPAVHFRVETFLPAGGTQHCKLRTQCSRFRQVPLQPRQRQDANLQAAI